MVTETPKRRLLVLGGSNMDLSIKTPRLPAPGETILGSDFYQAHGGKGANQAIAAARAGAEVAFLAAVGDDAFGRRALEQYRREGLNIERVKIVENRPHGVALILVDETGGNMIAVYPGANAALSAEDILAVPDADFCRCRVFAAQLETPMPAVMTGFSRARSLGLLTILNPAPAAPEGLPLDLWPMIDVIVPNEAEAGQLTAMEVTGVGSARRAARELIRRGCRAAVITLGSRGCVVLDAKAAALGNGGVHLPAPHVTAIDTVAAGDAFIGALACRLAELDPAPEKFGNTLIEAARWASHAAAISVTRPGAQPSLPFRDEIEQSLIENP